MTIQTISSSWTAAWPGCLTVSRCLTVSSDMVSRTNNKSDPRPDLAICPLQCTDRHRHLGSWGHIQQITHGNSSLQGENRFCLKMINAPLLGHCAVKGMSTWRLAWHSCQSDSRLWPSLLRSSSSRSECPHRRPLTSSSCPDTPQAPHLFLTWEPESIPQ